MEHYPHSQFKGLLPKTHDFISSFKHKGQAFRKEGTGTLVSEQQQQQRQYFSQSKQYHLALLLGKLSISKLLY